MHPPRSKYIAIEILFRSEIDTQVLKTCMSLNTPSEHNNNKAAGGPNQVMTANNICLAGLAVFLP